MKNICKKISAFIILFVYLLVLCPAALAADAVQIDSTALTTIPATVYVAENGTAVTEDTTTTSGATRIVIPSGGVVSYNVIAPKDGYYKLLIYGKAVSSKPTITVEGTVENVTYGMGIAESTDRRYTIGRFYMTEGENSISLTFSRSVNIKELLIKSVDHVIASSGKTILEAHDYHTSNITVLDREDAQWSYGSSNTGVSVTGPVIVVASDSAKRVCTYRVNVEEEGLYKLTAYSAFYNRGTATYTLSVNGAQISKGTHTPSETLSGVQKCEGADLETFNLASGEQTLTIRSSTAGSGSQLYTYYYVFERVGDFVTRGEIGTEEITLEGENLFYVDAGVETADDAIKISDATARADSDVLNSGLYAMTLRYKADEDTPVYVRLGTGDEKYQTLAKTEGEYVDFVYQTSVLDVGLLRLLINTEGTIYIDSVTFTPIDEGVASDFVEAVNAAASIDKLLNVFELYEESLGINYKNASQTLLYKDLLYERVLSENYEDFEEFSAAFADYVSRESLMKRLTINNGTKNILGLESGNLSMKLDTSYFAENTASIAAAIYEESEYKKLMMVDIKDYNGEPEIAFNFVNLVLEADKNYSFKIIYFNDLDTITPKEMYKDVYKEIFVSQGGSDVSGDGSEALPFASVARAVEEAQTISSSQHGDITIKVASGTYTLSDTLTFDENNSGKNGYRLTIEGDKENPPVISGGKEVTGWQAEENGIYSAPLSGVEYVRNLYIDGYPAVRARSEQRYQAGPSHYNGIPTTVYKGDVVSNGDNLDVADSGFDIDELNNNLKDTGYQEKATKSKDGFTVSKEYVPIKFAKPQDLELVWMYLGGTNWESRRTPVDGAIETSTHTTFLLDKGLLSYIPSRFRNGSIFYFENAKELLDTPGEFYYDKSEGRIYYMPHEGENMESAETYIGTLEQMVNITGSSVDKKAENITFKNLVFRYGTYDFVDKYGYDGQQADAFQSNFRGEDGEEQQMSQIYVENAKGIEIKDCEISCMGSAGIHFKEGVNDSLIEGNMIRDLSGTGVIIGHPSHSSKQTGVTVCDGIAVKNNVFRRNAAEYLNNTQISLYYEKNIDILHNDIDMAPYSGITASWGWEGSNPYDCYNIDISYNKITNVMQLLNDGGAIYTVGHLENSIISNNYINGSKGTVAGVMYQDSGSAYMEIFNNVILNGKKSIYRNPNNDHDLKYYNNYSNISECDTSIPEKNIYVEAPIKVDADNLTGEALSIYNAAGVENQYKYLVAKDEFPSWRRTRISLPSYTNPDITTISASKFIASESSSGLELDKTYTGASSVTVKAGQYITFPINVEKTGTYKILINGKRISSSKPNISVADHTKINSGLGVQTTTVKTYTIGRYTLSEGADKLKFSVSNAGGIVINSVQIKNVDHEIVPVGKNLIEIHDYYSANISSYDHEDNQSGYESSNCDKIVTGPIIASAASTAPTRELTYKMNVEQAGTYRMNIYYAGGAAANFKALADGVQLGEISAKGTGNSDGNKCSKVTIEGITLSGGDITFGLKFTASGSGHIFAYYYELERVGN